MSGQDVEHTQVAIVGTGFAGLGTAIRLDEEGFRDFLLLERADEVGGTWRDNSYPGCACDVPSNLYSLSYEPNPRWKHSFSRQPQIFDYLRSVTDRHGLRDRLRTGHEVLGADWDPEAQRWRIETAGGELTADVLVGAMGGLSDPAYPDIPGLEEFAGPTFHSATWDHDVDLRGKRVAVIGTGASAIQFIPEIQPVVGHLDLFQRTPPWIVPRRDRPITRLEHRLYERFPALQRAVRGAIYWGREGMVVGFRHPQVMRIVEKVAAKHLDEQVSDPVKREKLRPHFRLGCKRVLLSNDYYPALDAPNADVVTSGIERITPTGVLDRDGVEHPADVLILGTGFRVNDMPIADRVRDGEGRSLADHWQGSMQAHLGSTVKGFPNLFLMLGPNSALGHTSVVFMIEAQVEHLVGAMRHLRATGAAEVEVREDVQDAFNERIQRQTEGTVWTSGGCSSWYLDRTGRNRTLWPTFTKPFQRQASQFRPEEHVLRPRRTREPELVPA